MLQLKFIGWGKPGCEGEVQVRDPKQTDRRAGNGTPRKVTRKNGTIKHSKTK